MRLIEQLGVFALKVPSPQQPVNTIPCQAVHIIEKKKKGLPFFL